VSSVRGGSLSVFAVVSHTYRAEAKRKEEEERLAKEKAAAE